MRWQRALLVVGLAAGIAVPVSAQPKLRVSIVERTDAHAIRWART